MSKETNSIKKTHKRLRYVLRRLTRVQFLEHQPTDRRVFVSVYFQTPNILRPARSPTHSYSLSLSLAIATPFFFFPFPSVRPKKRVSYLSSFSSVRIVSLPSLPFLGWLAGWLVGIERARVPLKVTAAFACLLQEERVEWK